MVAINWMGLEVNFELRSGTPKAYFESYREARRAGGHYRTAILGLLGLHVEASLRRKGSR